MTRTARASVGVLAIGTALVLGQGANVFGQGPDEFGRGAYQPGPGIVSPVLLQSEKPAYPRSALDARVQGTVELEAVVLKDGTVGQIRTVRSLDSMKALEEAALAAARGWRFKAGSVGGQPVPTIVRLAVQFTLGPAGFGAVEVLSGPRPSEDPFFKGAFWPGGSLIKPVLATKVEPKYTREAMRQKIQGTVELEAVVEKDGSVGPLRVTKSLDSAFGLDEAALAAARQWTFRPGTVDGQPVRVIVKLVLEFRLH